MEEDSFTAAPKTVYPSLFWKVINKRKRLWFIDKYTGEKVNPYPSNYRKDYNFSEGGTLWAMVHDFCEFIITGKYTNGNNGYGGLYCQSWGYPEKDIQAIRQISHGIRLLGLSRIN